MGGGSTNLGNIPKKYLFFSASLIRIWYGQIKYYFAELGGSRPPWPLMVEIRKLEFDYLHQQ